MKREQQCLKALVVLALVGALVAIQAPAAVATPEVPHAALNPADVPPPLARSAPATVTVNLEAKEVIGEIAPGKEAWIWTFNGTVPGPMIRVMEGDTVVVNLTNRLDSIEPHNIDFHAAMGPGGGAAVTNVEPGETRTLTFKAMRQGAYIYHCAGEGMPWEHVAYGMYGLIMVEPVGGLKKVDKEFYVGQSDWYFRTNAERNAERVAQGKAPRHFVADPVRDDAILVLDEDKAFAEHPDMFSFNGHKGALADHAIYGETIRADVGDTVRFFFVTGGPNIASNWHIIGQIFDNVYKGHAKDVDRNEETVVVPPGSAAVFELTALVPGKYLIVDHALFRVPKGAAGFLWVDPQCADAETCEWPDDIFFPPATGTGH